MNFFSKNNSLNKNLNRDRRNFLLSNDKVNMILGKNTENDSTSNETEDITDECIEVKEMLKSISESLSKMQQITTSTSNTTKIQINEKENNFEDEDNFLNKIENTAYKQYIKPLKITKDSIFDKLKSSISNSSNKMQEYNKTKLNVNDNNDLIEKISNYCTNQNLKLDFESEKIVKLNVGGKKFVTYKKNFDKYPDSSLSVFISKKEKMLKNIGLNSKNRDKHGKEVEKKSIKNDFYFIDRDPQIFQYVISFLRNDKLPIFMASSDEILFYEELEYWGINLKIKKSQYYSLLKFDENWCANTLSLDENCSIVNKHNSTHGIVFTKLCLDRHNSYIEFKVEMKIPSNGSSHLFVGVLDKSKYSIDHLSKFLIKLSILILERFTKFILLGCLEQQINQN